MGKNAVIDVIEGLSVQLTEYTTLAVKAMDKDLKMRGCDPVNNDWVRGNFGFTEYALMTRAVYLRFCFA